MSENVCERKSKDSCERPGREKIRENAPLDAFAQARFRRSTSWTNSINLSRHSLLPATSVFRFFSSHIHAECQARGSPERKVRRNPDPGPGTATHIFPGADNRSHSTSGGGHK